jgi:hypothetical protein
MKKFSYKIEKKKEKLFLREKKECVNKKVAGSNF